VFYIQGATRNIIYASNSRIYIDEVGLQPIYISGYHSKGAANELHEVYKMLQSTSQMATVHDFLATEGCDWKFIPPHGPHLEDYGREQ
jgi:hypothetical protein